MPSYASRFRSLSPLLLSLAALALCACSSAAGGRLRAPAFVGPTSGAVAPLAGGETDDNARLPEYLEYVAAYPHQDLPKLDLSDRRLLSLRDGFGRPLWDEAVTLRDAGQREVFRARTDAGGRLLLPPAALGLPVGAPLVAELTEHGHVRLPVPLQGDVLRLAEVAARPPSRVALDVALVVDTTGSMADEVERLRTTLRSVVSKIVQHPSAPFVRVGGVAFRDVGEAYVTRPFRFSSDLGAVQRTLDALRVGGGGDPPEAVQEALEEAVTRLDWAGPGSIRLLFLIGDAPPHLERGTPYTVTLRAAVERGIVIVPVACSGLNDTGEFVFRQLAAVTMGRFLFVSYGGSTGNHTGSFEQNDLDLLMARTAWEALDAVEGRSSGGPPTVIASPEGWVGAPMEAKRRTGYGRAPAEFGAPGAAVPGWTR